MPKVSGTDWKHIPFQGKFTFIHVSDLQCIVSLFSCWFCGLDCPCAWSSPWWVNAGLTAGEGAGGQLLLLPEGCGLALPSSFHCLCAQHSDLLTLFSIESGSVPSQGLCPHSLCLEYFVQDSLWPGFTWFPTILASAQNLWELIIPMGTNSCGLGKTRTFAS